MAAVLDHDYETTARLELRALERMIGALCAQIEGWTREAPPQSKVRPREADLQLQAFVERRTRALQALNATTEPSETRIARLEKAVEALLCSQQYFRAARMS